MVYIESNCVDPRWNLALEEYVFTQMPTNQSYFMLWQNRNTIVIGKNQNTIAEINSEYVKEHDIQVVRRLSGGGAVYHDLGNLNFTFITDAEKADEIDFAKFCVPVVQTLHSFGVPAEINGRNDMTIHGKKFSGNAQYVQKCRVLHHGTILFSSDSGVISQALHANKEKLQSKGIASVSSRVCNIADFLPEDISLDAFKAALVRNVMKTETPDVYKFSPEQINAVEQIKKNRYDLWEWNYGHSPRYEIMKAKRFQGCGIVEVSMNVSKGVIQSIRFTGDFFNIDNVEQLCRILIGTAVNKIALTDRLRDVCVERYVKGLSTQQLIELLSEG